MDSKVLNDTTFRVKFRRIVHQENIKKEKKKVIYLHKIRRPINSNFSEENWT